MIGRTGFAVLALLAATTVLANGSRRSPSGSDVVVIQAGYQSGIRHTAVFHVRDAGEFADMWGQHGGNSSPVPKPPALRTDFDRRHVLGVFLGTRPTGGFEMRVVSVRMLSGKVRIQLEERFPGPDCIVTAATTQPFAIVEVPSLPWHPTFELAVARHAGPPCE